MLAGPERLGRDCGLGWTTPGLEDVVVAEVRSGLIVVLGPAEGWPRVGSSWMGSLSMMAVMLS